MNQYRDMLIQMGQSTPKGAFACRELDLTKPEDVKFVAAQFGGADRMAERYPCLHAMFKRTVETAVPLRDTGNRGFQDKAKVLDLGYDSDFGAPYATGTMTLTEPAQRLYMTLDIFADNIRIAHYAKFFSGCVSGEIEIQAEPMEPLPDGKLYTACLHATWEPGKSGRIRSQVASHEITAGAKDLVKKFTVTNPKHKKSPLDGAITVAYGRVAENLDYYYDETRSGNGDEMVSLEVDGQIDLLDGYHVSDVSNGGAAMSCEGFGDIIYMGSVKYGPTAGKDGAVFFPVNGGTGIGWKLDKYWNNQIPDSVRFGNRVHALEFGFSFRCKEDQTFHDVLLTSKATELMINQPHVEKISQIHLYWGCLAKGTKVMLSDGMEVNIEDVRPGNALRKPGGGYSVVKSIITGTEKNIYRVRLSNGVEVCATRTHPLGAPDGFIAPIELNSKSTLRTKKGICDVIYCYPETWNGPVYSIELESGDSFYANGVVSGTNKVMGDLADKWVNERETLKVDIDAAEERDRLEADFLNGLL